jgi:hypothetical protein
MLPAHRVKSVHGALDGPAISEPTSLQGTVPATAANFGRYRFQQEERRIGGGASLG